MFSGKNQKKIIIIGAGISGLSTGIFGQKNGYTTEIFEKNPVAGGLCRCWNRKGFNIDGCIHWLTGVKPDSPIRRLWDELEAFEDDQIISTDNFGTYEFARKTVTFWADLEKLEKELVEISPKDSRQIHKTIKYIKLFQNMHLPIEVPLSLMGYGDLLRVATDTLKYLPQYIKCNKIMASDYANKFKSSVIRESFKHIIPDNTNLYSTLYAYGTVASGNGGVLEGGSDTLIKNLVNSYENNGGFIHYNSDVKRILIKENKAIGIELQNGEKIYADFVVSASDPFNSVSLLEAQERIKIFYKHINDEKAYPIPSCILVHYAIDKESLDSLHLTSTYEFQSRPFLVGNKHKNSIRIRDYSYDKTFINDGKSVVQVMISQTDSDYDFWNSFSNKNEYNNAKLQVANEIKAEIERKFPILKDKIETLDVCTHKTFERYTRSYHGSFQPFMLTAKGKMLNHNGKIGKIKNLFVASQWGITPGGIPIAMLSGKFTIQRILHSQRLNFKITKRYKYKFYK